MHSGPWAPGSRPRCDNRGFEITVSCPSRAAGLRSIVGVAVTDSQPAADSERVAVAQARAQERLHRQRASLRPLGWAVIGVVVLGSTNSRPVPGLHGTALVVTFALVVFAATLLVAIRNGFPERRLALQAAVIAVMGAAGVAIAGLQVNGAAGVAAGVAVFIAVTRLPFTAGVALGGAVTIALGIVTAAAGSSSATVAAGTLVTVLLGVIGQFLKQSRESQTQPRCCSRNSPTHAMSRRGRQPSPSAAELRASCMTCSRTRCPAPRSSCKQRASSPAANTPAPR
jgi:hypothetical protein